MKFARPTPRSDLTTSRSRVRGGAGSVRKSVRCPYSINYGQGDGRWAAPVRGDERSAQGCVRCPDMRKSWFS